MEAAAHPAGEGADGLAIAAWPCEPRDEPRDGVRGRRGRCHWCVNGLAGDVVVSHAALRPLRHAESGGGLRRGWAAVARVGGGGARVGCSSPLKGLLGRAGDVGTPPALKHSHLSAIYRHPTTEGLKGACQRISSSHWLEVSIAIAHHHRLVAPPVACSRDAFCRSLTVACRRSSSSRPSCPTPSSWLCR